MVGNIKKSISGFRTVSLHVALPISGAATTRVESAGSPAMIRPSCRAADRQLGRIIAGLPADSTLVVAAPEIGRATCRETVRKPEIDFFILPTIYTVVFEILLINASYISLVSLY